MRILEKLARPPVILFSLISMILIGGSFAYFQKFVGGDLLDISMSGPDALKRLGEMTDAHKQAHTWITLFLDSLYPIAYGSFFAGATYKLLGHTKGWLTFPALLTVIADFGENIAQMLAMNGQENLIMAKSILTPIKFSMLIIMSLILLSVFLLWIIKRKSSLSHG